MIKLTWTKVQKWKNGKKGGKFEKKVEKKKSRFRAFATRAKNGGKCWTYFFLTYWIVCNSQIRIKDVSEFD